jgi:hypothetical protein
MLTLLLMSLTLAPTPVPPETRALPEGTVLQLPLAYPEVLGPDLFLVPRPSLERAIQDRHALGQCVAALATCDAEVCSEPDEVTPAWVLPVVVSLVAGVVVAGSIAAVAVAVR